jgi:uncharacterized protein YbjT (DUF2867 family)
MILVTGATSPVGSQVAKGLHVSGVPFRAGVHSRPAAIDGVETCAIDYDRPETLRPALEGVDTVFLVSMGVLHEQAMVEACIETGASRIVKLSAWNSDGETYSEGKKHRVVERAIEKSGIPWTFLRPNFFMQNFLTTHADSICGEDAFYDAVGEARISHVDTRDVARVGVRALTELGHEGRAYELSGPEALTHEEIAETFSRMLGRTIRYKRLGDHEMKKFWVSKGYGENDAQDYVDVARWASQGSAAGVTNTIWEVTGQEPTSFALFCRDHAQWFTSTKELRRSTEADGP